MAACCDAENVRRQEADAEDIVLTALRSVRTHLLHLHSFPVPAAAASAPVPPRLTESEVMQQASAGLCTLFTIGRLHPELLRATLNTKVFTERAKSSSKFGDAYSFSPY